MEQREKLIELLIEADMQLKYPSEEECKCCDLHDVGRCDMVHMVDHLLANGVVVLPCRCGECEYQQECKNAQYFGLDGFCSIGKRKGGDYCDEE